MDGCGEISDLLAVSMDYASNVELGQVSCRNPKLLRFEIPQ